MLLQPFYAIVVENRHKIKHNIKTSLLVILGENQPPIKVLSILIYLREFSPANKLK